MSTHLFEIILIVLIFTILLPILFTILYSKDLFLRNENKRPLVLLVTVLCYSISFFLLRNILHTSPTFENLHTPLHNLLLFLAVLIIGTIFVLYVTFWFKISLHANGIGFILALISFLVLDPEIAISIRLLALGITIIPCGLLLWQRVASHSHSLREVVYGLCFGFTISFMTFLLLPNNGLWLKFVIW